MRFSVISIVYNEEKRLNKALSVFLPYTDDIVIVNTESTDSTLGIAKGVTNKILTVPFVGYCDCYKETAQWKAKYDWVLWSYADEVWGEDLLFWIKNLSENIKEDSIYLHRYEEIDGKREETDFGWHLRLHRKGAVYHPDLMDCDIPLSEKYLEENRFFLHSKSTVEYELDLKLRRISCELLINKYRFTELEPYKSYVEAYKDWLQKNPL